MQDPRSGLDQLNNGLVRGIVEKSLCGENMQISSFVRLLLVSRQFRAEALSYVRAAFLKAITLTTNVDDRDKISMNGFMVSSTQAIGMLFLLDKLEVCPRKIDFGELTHQDNNGLVQAIARLNLNEVHELRLADSCHGHLCCIRLASECQNVKVLWNAPGSVLMSLKADVKHLELRANWPNDLSHFVQQKLRTETNRDVYDFEVLAKTREVLSQIPQVESLTIKYSFLYCPRPVFYRALLQSCSPNYLYLPLHIDLEQGLSGFEENLRFLHHWSDGESTRCLVPRISIDMFSPRKSERGMSCFNAHDVNLDVSKVLRAFEVSEVTFKYYDLMFFEALPLEEFLLTAVAHGDRSLSLPKFTLQMKTVCRKKPCAEELLVLEQLCLARGMRLASSYSTQHKFGIRVETTNGDISIDVAFLDFYVERVLNGVRKDAVQYQR